MKLPRDLGGRELARLLQPFGYEIVRQEGSHLRLTSNYKGYPHHITIPGHSELKIGTLHKILRLAATYLELTPSELSQRLFDR